MQNWYCYGKVLAERTAWEESKQRGVEMVVINPVLVVGPLLQPTVNASTAHILKYLTGAVKTYANSVQAYVHVRDVAAAHILIFESPSAEGRYLCSESSLHRGEVVEILAKYFPEYPIPTKYVHETAIVFSLVLNVKVVTLLAIIHSVLWCFFVFCG